MFYIEKLKFALRERNFLDKEENGCYFQSAKTRPIEIVLRGYVIDPRKKLSYICEFTDLRSESHGIWTKLIISG